MTRNRYASEKPRRRWTADQIEVVRSRHGKASYAEIGAAIGRSASSVAQMCRKLGLPSLVDWHGKRDSPTHNSWTAAIGRCHNPNDPSYARYGSAGITVCPAWRNSFAAFRADMGDRPRGTSLDRIDNLRGYEPGNCRWATPAEQSRNRRSTKFVEVNGRRVNFMEACEAAGVPAGTVRARLRTGYSVEAALSLPVFKGGKLAEWRAGA